MEMIQFFSYNYFVYYMRNGLLYYVFFYDFLILFFLNFLMGNIEIYKFVWLIIFISTFLSLDLLFKQDFSDGRLEILYLSETPFLVYIYYKYFYYWGFCHLPFLLVISVFGSFDLISFFCLICGSLSCVLLGGCLYIITFSLQGKSLLLSLMVFPLFFPILIYGAYYGLYYLLLLIIILLVFIPFLTTTILSKIIT